MREEILSARQVLVPDLRADPRRVDYEQEHVSSASEHGIGDTLDLVAARAVDETYLAEGSAQCGVEIRPLRLGVRPRRGLCDVENEVHGCSLTPSG